jgi:hypothetical protein
VHTPRFADPKGLKSCSEWLGSSLESLKSFWSWWEKLRRTNLEARVAAPRFGAYLRGAQIGPAPGLLKPAARRVGPGRIAVASRLRRTTRKLNYPNKNTETFASFEWIRFNLFDCGATSPLGERRFGRGARGRLRRVPPWCFSRATPFGDIRPDFASRGPPLVHEEDQALRRRYQRRRRVDRARDVVRQSRRRRRPRGFCANDAAGSAATTPGPRSSSFRRSAPSTARSASPTLMRRPS